MLPPQAAFMMFLELFMLGVLALVEALLVVALALEKWLGREGAQD